MVVVCLAAERAFTIRPRIPVPFTAGIVRVEQAYECVPQLDSFMDTYLHTSVVLIGVSSFPEPQADRTRNRGHSERLTWSSSRDGRHESKSFKLRGKRCLAQKRTLAPRQAPGFPESRLFVCLCHSTCSVLVTLSSQSWRSHHADDWTSSNRFSKVSPFQSLAQIAGS